MSEVPEGLYYTKEHEWMRVEGDTVTIGITDHVQDMLTDIVYIELPEEGDVVGDMGEFAVVESVKSASPIFAPLAGTITASWGDQMRSYFLYGQQLVKDLRTGHEVGNPATVFDGDLDGFIAAGIRWRKRKDDDD